MINKEVLRINVNRSYDFVAIYNSQIKSAFCFSTALFYLRANYDDTGVELYSDDSDFISRCGAKPMLLNKKLFEGDYIYLSYDENNLAIVTKINDASLSDSSVLCCGRFYVGSVPYIYIYSNSAYNNVSVDDKEVVIVYNENTPDKLWSSAYGMCTSTILCADDNIKGVPNYRSIFNVGDKNAKHKRDYNTNSLNEITTILPVYFYVKDTPYTLNMWKYIGMTDFLGVVSMYNMDTFHISQIDYPVSGNRYLCCSFYKRRLVDFRGIAIRLSNLLETISDNLIDFTGMQSNTADKVISIKNENTGIEAYGGDCVFIDGTPGGSIEFISDIYKYQKVIVEYTDDSGLDLHSVEINVDYLQNNSTNSYFDLLMGNNHGLFWHIDLTKSTGLFLSGVNQNCGIVSIKGVASTVEDDYSNELPSVQ